MQKATKVGVLGDFDPAKVSHPAINHSIRHSARKLSLETAVTWLPTASLLTGAGQTGLLAYDCLWAASGDPQSPQGLIRGIQIVRELDRPFLGT